jgi:hypothetical protein
MFRTKIRENMVSYLQEQINCDNVLKKTDALIESDEKLLINGTPVSFKVISYDDENETEKKSIEILNNVFDEITESNSIGFDYYPFIYGILNCHNDTKSNLYVFYEFLSGTLYDLFENLQSPNEWYDIIFQMAMIDYNATKRQSLKHLNYNLDNYYFIKLFNPQKKEYVIKGKNITIYHKYVVVFFSWEIIDEWIKGIKYLSDIIKDDKYKTTQRIITMVSEMNTSERIEDVIETYYSFKGDAI